MESTDFCIFGSRLRNNKKNLISKHYLNVNNKPKLYRNFSLLSTKNKSKSIIKCSNKINISSNFSDIFAQDNWSRKDDYNMQLNKKSTISSSKLASSYYPKERHNEVDEITANIMKMLGSLNINSYNFSRLLNLKSKIAKKIKLENFLKLASAKYLSDKINFVPDFSPTVKKIVFTPQNKIITIAKHRSKLHESSSNMIKKNSIYPTFKAIIIKKRCKKLFNKFDSANLTENKNLFFKLSNMRAHLFNDRIISAQQPEFTQSKCFVGHRKPIFHRKILSRVTNLNLNLNHDRKCFRNTYNPELNRSNA